ncbi:MAG: PaaI family thioesterase, partial [Pseudomonadota bacterium]
GGSVLCDVLTQEMKINYTRPAVGETLVARASVVSSGKRQAVCRCDVFVVAGGVEKICAAAQGTVLKAK